MFTLEGKKALVTGASGGIGGEIAKALDAAGARVAISGTRREKLDELAKELKNDPVALTCNLKDLEAVDNLPKQAEEVLGGLTRGQDPAKLHLSFRRETASLGAILPNNSPGVHSLWLPAIALQIPLALKPGSREPWTPYRMAQAMMRAGCPPEAFGYFPTNVNGTREILTRCSGVNSIACCLAARSSVS